MPPTSGEVTTQVGHRYPSGETIRAARLAKGWSIADAARALTQRYGPGLPTIDSLIRSWKRWEHGTLPGRTYRAIVLDLLGLDAPGAAYPPPGAFHPSAEIPLVFANQQLAADEIRTLAPDATSVDVLAVRGLGLVALKDSLLRPALEAATRPVRLRMLLLRPGSEAANRRATEIGETPETFTAGLELAASRLRELAATSPATIEVYEYDTTPTWRIIAIDNTLYVSTFSEDWEGHESVTYKIVPTPTGPLHRSFRRMYDDIRQRATHII